MKSKRDPGTVRFDSGGANVVWANKHPVIERKCYGELYDLPTRTTDAPGKTVCAPAYHRHVRTNNSKSYIHT